MKFNIKDSPLYSEHLMKRFTTISEKTADAFKEEVESLTPVRTGYLKSRWEKRKDDDGFVIENDAPYAKFVNDGTSKQVGQRFVERAEMLVNQRMRSIVKEGLDEVK